MSTVKKDSISNVNNAFDEAYYTITEVSQMLRLSRTKTYEMARDGSFPVVQIGRVLRVPVSKFQLWLNSNMVCPQGAVPLKNASESG